MIKKIVVCALLFLTSHALNAFYCPYQCTLDPLMQFYPNQNMCLLLDEIPTQLQNLSYGIYPNCLFYNTARFSYNKRFNFFPHAIFVPENADQIMYLLSIFKSYHLKFAVRSGGHCYGPGSLSDGYIIDLRNFCDIIPDVANQTVYIGAGVHLGQVIQTLGALDFAIPTGTCPSVGVTGLALGGGIGFLARKYGLTCDSIISMTMIDANGDLLEVSKNNFPDLFWALRGAGATAYGIVIGFTFKMHYIPTVQLVNLTWDFDRKTGFEVLERWQEWIKTIPESITTEVVFRYMEGFAQIHVNALKVGSKPLKEWKIAFENLNPQVAYYKGPYLGAAELSASNYTMPFSKVKSKFLFKPLAKKGTAVILDFMEDLLKTHQDFIGFIEIGSAGGAIKKGDSAYFPRKAFAWMFMFLYWPEEFQSHEALCLLNSVYNGLEPYTSEYSYANLVDYELGNTYLHAYYGNHIDRLVSIKNIYDPTNLFRWRQGIPLVYHPPTCSDCHS